VTRKKYLQLQLKLQYYSCSTSIHDDLHIRTSMQLLLFACLY